MGKPGVTPRPAIERVLARMAGRMKPGACWLWPGARNNQGYGVVGAAGRRLGYVHRVVYEAFVGPIPSGLALDHLCRVRACCNPAHLEPVTDRVNMLRGEHLSAVTARTNRCQYGHDMTDALVRAGGGRNCRKCKQRRDRAYYARRKQLID